MPEQPTRQYAPSDSTDDQNRPGADRADPGPAPQGTQRFTVLGLHAEGGLGRVSVARDERIGRDVALKEIRPDRLGDDEIRRRFLAEARITGQLEHPGVVPVYDLDEDADGRACYAMRFVDGRTFKEALRAYQDRPDRSALRGLLQQLAAVCQAVAFAHSRGVIHRDLKPANVILGDFGETLVVDWGLAKRVGDPDGAAAPGATAAGPGDTVDAAPATGLDGEPQTRAGQVMGTPAYMAPEQAAGDIDRIGPAADVYALGVMLYELLAGQPPHVGRDTADVLSRVRKGVIVPPSRSRRGVPRGLEAVCLKALRCEPAGRYADAAGLADDLTRWLADEPVSARREPAAARAGRWVRRHQTVTAAAGVLIAAAAVAAGVGAALISREQSKTAAALADERAALAEARDQRGRARAALRRSRLVSADLALERGQTLCDAREVGTGLLWFVRGLELAPTDAGPVRRVLRANLAAWSGRAVALRGWGVLPSSPAAAGLTPDGRSWVVGAEALGVFVCDATTGRADGEPMPHPRKVNAVAVTADGRFALTTCTDGRARLWGLARRHQVWASGFDSPLFAAAVAPDGGLFAVGAGDGRVWLLDPATGEPTGPPLLARGPVRGLAFTPDGKTLVTGDGAGDLRRWRMPSGEPIGGPLSRRRTAVLSLAVSPDGRLALAGYFTDEAVLWDLSKGEPAGPPLSHDGSVIAAAFSPGGRLFATGCSGTTAAVWNTADLSPAGPPLPHNGMVAAVGFAGDSLLTGSADMGVRVWGLPSGAPTAVKAKPDASLKMIGKYAVRPDGEAAALGSLRGPIQAVGSANGAALGSPGKADGPVIGLTYTADGKRVLAATMGKGARLYNAATWRPAGPPLPHEGWITGVAAAGGVLLTAGRNREARAWRADGSAAGPPFVHPDEALGGLLSAALSPDGKLAAAGAMDGSATIWDVASGQVRRVLRQGERAQVWAVAFSPDGSRVAAGCDDGAARVWDAATGRPITPPLRHRGPLHSVKFSPDGRLVITASNDKTVCVWDAATGKRVGPRLRHGAMVRRAAFKPDGRSLVTLDAHTKFRTWDVPTALDGDRGRVALFVRVIGGRRLDGAGGVHTLSAAEWAAALAELSAAGGPPELR